MTKGYDGLPPSYIGQGSPFTPNFGLSVDGMDPVLAENMYLIDTAIHNATTPPGGPNTAVQFNNSGTFGGDSSFLWDNTNKNLTFTDASISRVSAGTIQIGVSGSNSSGSLQLKAVTITDTAANTDLTIQNTTAATSGTSQSSPLITINGTYWTGSASATDSWTIQDVVGNGTNGASTLTFGHSGTTGTTTIDVSSSSVLKTGGIQNINNDCKFFNTGMYFTTGGFGTSSWGIFIDPSNAFGLGPTLPLTWSSALPANVNKDSGLSRISAGVLGLGNGTQGDTTGNLQLNKITKYNAETTAGTGVAYIRGSTVQRSETGADTNLLTVTPPAATGLYRISVVFSVSAASAATLGWTATWTDSNGHAQTPANLSIGTAGSAPETLTVTAAANTTYFGEWYIDVNNAGTNIVVKTTFSGSSISYLASATVERIA